MHYSNRYSENKCLCDHMCKLLEVGGALAISSSSSKFEAAMIAKRWPAAGIWSFSKVQKSYQLLL